ncbi:uncharacterized protein LOC134186626 [Corticium candelabrum]|uniref:uncharacterized protein LOC134186626 n=1 Tax=Corticium candelabrum TaxID=121492 RepID=UPI002E261731|nr:uncharacterized protein LOC134186626 [Corticium candelabrum]
MPLGNGDLASNVWLENSTGDVLFYLAKPDAWDSNANLLKAGRVRIHYDPPLYTVADSQQYKQTLDLLTGSVSIESAGYSVLLFIDSSLNTFRVKTQRTDAKPFGATVSLEVWRTSPTAASGSFCKARITSPDTVVDPVPTYFTGSIVWYHRNLLKSGTTDYWTDALTLQGLGSLTKLLWDPLANVTFGGIIRGPNLKRLNSTTLAGSDLKELDVAVTVETLQANNSVDEWFEYVNKQASSNPDVDVSFNKTAAAWMSFWSRSGVIINDTSGGEGPTNDGYMISAQSVYQRFLDACDGRGSLPIKFNGQLFSVDVGKGPDYRDWGGGFWWQNTRQPYYNMLASGDLDLLRAVYPFYLRLLPLVGNRTQIYFNHSGGYFPETMTHFGTYENGGLGYGCTQKQKDIGIPDNTYIRYHIVGSLELVFLMLDDFHFTQDKTVAETFLLPIAEMVLTYYDEHWPQKDSQGKTIFFPAQSLETWQCKSVPARVEDCVTNPTPDMAGLHAILPRMLQLPASGVTVDPKEVDRWKRMLGSLPEIPVGKDQHGATVVTPGEKLPARTSNSENTELYTVHPFRLYTFAGTNETLTLARNTYNARRFPCNNGWCQDVMDAALLGLTDDAKGKVTDRAKASPAAGWRFTGFAAHYQDYEPSLDHLSTMRTAVHYMLVQWSSVNDTVFLFPSWPTQWDVTFRLHAPLSTVIEASCIGGKLKSLTVTPDTRKKDIKVINCSM